VAFVDGPGSGTWVYLAETPPVTVGSSLAHRVWVFFGALYTPEEAVDEDRYRDET